MGISSDTEYDVVLIDEIQMIADPFRGYAWTRALLGMRCQEIHLCGGMEAKNIIEKMVKYCGDELEIYEYKRFRYDLIYFVPFLFNDVPVCVQIVEPSIFFV